jgi:acetyltransferase
MLTIRPVAPADASLTPGLTHLLLDTVAGGGSVGFLADLTPAAATAYWHTVFAGLGPALALWVAEEAGQVVGTIQLALCQKPNGTHRAEVQKLLVLREARRAGIATRLMATAETAARQQGRTLLFLDTEAGSAAEILYQALGWHQGGAIPDYFVTPAGALHTTAIYYKQL